MNIFFFINYWCPKIRTYPSLSMPPIYHTYSEKELINEPKVRIEDGIQEIGVIYQHRKRQELYTIQQSLYGNVYCHRFFRPLSKPRLCYNTILLKGVSDGETQTQKIHRRV